MSIFVETGAGETKHTMADLEMGTLGRITEEARIGTYHLDLLLHQGDIVTVTRVSGYEFCLVLLSGDGIKSSVPVRSAVLETIKAEPLKTGEWIKLTAK